MKKISENNFLHDYGLGITKRTKQLARNCADIVFAHKIINLSGKEEMVLFDSRG